jgi:hypothetical protein
MTLTKSITFIFSLLLKKMIEDRDFTFFQRQNIGYHSPTIVKNTKCLNHEKDSGVQTHRRAPSRARRPNREAYMDIGPQKKS